MKNVKTIILLLLFGMLVGGMVMVVQSYSGEPLVYPPNITIIFPVNNTNYVTTILDLNWTSNESLINDSYVLDGILNDFNFDYILTTTTGDGYVYKDGIDAMDSWSLIHDALTGSYVDYISESASARSYVGGSSFYYQIDRAFFPINTSTLPNNAIILNASFNVNVSSIQINQDDGNTFLTVVGNTSQLSNSSLILDDYDKDGIVSNPIEFSKRIMLNSINVLKYNRFILNDTGFGSINKDGITLFGIREGHDVVNEQITWSGTSKNNLAVFRTFESKTQPYLNVTVKLHNITLISLSEGKHNISIYGQNNDSAIGQSSYIYFTINQTPQWSSNQTNTTSNTKLNDSIQFNVTLTDNANLSTSIFSWNVSGFWQNLTQINYTVTTTNTTLIINQTINQSSGKHKSWTIYFNDSIGNRNQSDIFTFNIANIIPNTTNISITELPITAGNTLRGHALYSDADNDIAGGNQTIWYVNKTRITEADNSFTLLGGNTTDNANITFSARYNDTYDWSNWINSSTVNVGDSTAPELINCTLSSTSITNSAGNVVNLTCTATDARSNVQTMVAYLNSTRLNKTLTLSLTLSQTATGTYSIFSSNEALPSTESYYSITQVNVTDSSGNKLSNTTNLDFTVTAASVDNGGTTSGGGGGLAPQPIQNITIVAPERCGNFVCEVCNETSPLGCVEETPLSCPQDCKLFSLDDTFCTPIFNCGNWRTQWFVNLTIFGVVAGLIYTQYTADKKKKKGRLG